ncbi:MAG TPA: Ni/Fe hydrogenase subunit alpha [Bryobacteraceae bacterium]|nr:Ni/Fe hydrogenase subunit alpha [Bryobacteraceae bacterium]
MSTKTIKVDFLARVEGEGGLVIKVKGNEVTEVKLRLFEPPRFFEAFLRGRDFREAPDLTARICGICPVAYQMSSAHAMEHAMGVEVGGQLRELRRLLYCGEWIESHVLHVYMLHAPDFLGYEDAIQMAKDHGDIVQRGLRMKKIGNEIMTVTGGREIHPINVRVGGFYKVPAKSAFRELEEKLKWARDAALETVAWVSTFEFPEFEPEYLFVSMRHPNEYPINEGRLVSSGGLDISARNYEDHFVEEHVEHSTALHSVMKGQGPYMVGPLARFNLNFDKLSPAAQDAARAAGLNGACTNPFRSIIVRAVETVYACDEALRIIQQYEPPAEASVPVEPRVSTGQAFTEAPRGTLYHRYRIDERGMIVDAKIVPPTSQNQKTIERDLREFVPPRLDMPMEKLRWQCEQAVRNYDPCISCSTHFLKLDVERD